MPPAGHTRPPHPVCHRTPSVADLCHAVQEHNDKKWIFTPEQRAHLYTSLFLPFRSFLLSNHEEIFDACINLLRNLQAVGLLVLAKNETFEVRDLSLQDIVFDIRQLTDILRQEATESDIRDFTNRDWEDRFWDHQLNTTVDISPEISETSRPERISFESARRLRKPHYRNLLCDVTFGALRARDIPKLSPTGDGPIVEEFDEFFLSLSKCRLKKFLSSVEFSPRSPGAHMPELDASRLDAIKIESLGPFRFKGTGNLEDHLTITPHKEILFYFEMQDFAPLYYNKVVHDDSVYKFDDLRMLDLIACHLRYEAPLAQVRTGIGYLYDEFYRHHFLFFGQQAINQVGRHPSLGVVEAVRKRFLYKPQCIAERSMTAEQVRTGFRERLHPMGYFLPQQMVDKPSQFRSEDVFKFRLDDLHETLRNWTPQTVFELRYPGYGS